MQIVTDIAKQYKRRVALTFAQEAVGRSVSYAAKPVTHLRIRGL